MMNDLLERICALSPGFKHLRDREDGNARLETDADVIAGIFEGQIACYKRIIAEQRETIERIQR